MGPTRRDDDELAARIGDAEVVRSGFDELPGPVVLLEGPEHRLVAMNAAYRAFSGRGGMLGQTMREAFPEMEPRIFELIERVYASGEPIHAREWPLEFDPGDGPMVFYADFDVLPRRRPDGTAHGILIQQTDVTERVLQREQARADAAEAQRRYRVAHDVVVELQQALLPAALPILPAVDLAARYVVAGAEQSAGGDWFDVRLLSGGRIGLVVGDVVGHGVAAAAVMSQLRAVMADALETSDDTVGAVARLERFAASVPGARSATVVVAVLDPAAGSLDYVTRGHPPPLLVDAAGRGRQLLAGGGGPLGSDAEGTPQRTVLAVGDLVVLFSDGLVERPERPYIEGLDSLVRVTEAAVDPEHGGTADRVCADAVEALGTDGFDDDVTILAAALCPHREPLELRAHPRPDDVAALRSSLREWLADLRVEPVQQLGLELTIGEAVDNAVEHGLRDRPDGAVTVRLGLAPDGRLHVRVHDDGGWREPGPVPPGRGRGLAALGSLGDDLDVVGTPEGTTVTFHIPVRQRARTTASEVPPPEPRTVGTFTSTLTGDPPRLVLTGPVDALAVDELRRDLARGSRGGLADLTVDLGEVTHLTSVGVAALAAAVGTGAAGGHPVRLVAPTGSVAAFVLDLVGLPRDGAAA